MGSRQADDWIHRLLSLLRLGVVGLCVLASVSLVKWRHDLREIRRIVGPSIGQNAAPDDIIFRARAFLRDSVGYRQNNSYFLLPIFRFMRPTALQVIREGGDCADRARAFIVILNLFDIRARKLALYDSSGQSVHAVAKVWTKRGPYYIDLLYNIAHEDANGNPLSLADLANESVLRASIQRAIAEGNTRAAGYPINDYNFANVHTLNWEKSAFMQAAYRLLVETLGDRRARAVPRPYLSEAPALMVLVAATGACVVILVLIVAIKSRSENSITGPLQPRNVGDPVRLPLAFAFGQRGEISNGVGGNGQVSAYPRVPDALSRGVD
jgi:hypothetical protein